MESRANMMWMTLWIVLLVGDITADHVITPVPVIQCGSGCWDGMQAAWGETIEVITKYDGCSTSCLSPIYPIFGEERSEAVYGLLFFQSQFVLKL
jgi:hypothetical protein